MSRSFSSQINELKECIQRDDATKTELNRLKECLEKTRAGSGGDADPIDDNASEQEQKVS